MTPAGDALPGGAAGGTVEGMTERLRVGVLVSGRGSNLQAILDAIGRGEVPAEVVVVVSDRADAPALDRARSAGIPAVFVDPAAHPTREALDGEIARVLREHRVELVALAGYMRILGPSFVAAFRHRVLNIHPSLLPAFPGLHAQRQALEYGVKVAGCTVHFVDEGVDTGPVILQAAVPVLDGDTEESLAARILEQEHRIYPQAIRLFAEGRLRLEGRRVRIAPGPEAGPGSRPGPIADRQPRVAAPEVSPRT